MDHLASLDTVDPVTPTEPAERPTRRALIAGALGGAAAWAASAIGRATPVRAGVDGDVVLGSQQNVAATTTAIKSSAAVTVLYVESSAGSGVIAAVQGNGSSTSGIGVFGESPGTGVLGSSFGGIGVRGASHSSFGVAAESSTGRAIDARSGSGWGVYGRSDSSHGIHGVCPANGGVGVYAESGAGTALEAHTTSGVALHIDGRFRAAKISGVATIGTGKASVTVTPGVDITNTSFVLLTPRADIGSRALWYTTDPTANTFRIRMSSSRASATPVAWLLLG